MELKIKGSTTRTLPSFMAVLNVGPCVKSAGPGIPSKKPYDLETCEPLAAFRHRFHDSGQTPRFCRHHNNLTRLAEVHRQLLTGEFAGWGGGAERLSPAHQSAQCQG
jgi:hypothetical protein